MSNVKSVHIVARVPFNWLMLDPEGEDGPQRQADLSFLASWLLTPSSNLGVSYTHDGTEPNDHGGITTMYVANFSGAEAIAWPGIDLLKEIVERRGGTILADNTYDMEEL